jgi:hypothetical protein
MRQLDYFLAERPRDKEIVSGDAGVIKEFDSKLFIGIIDALGHGQDAYKIALICQAFLEKKWRQDLVKLMKTLTSNSGVRGVRSLACAFWTWKRAS